MHTTRQHTARPTTSTRTWGGLVSVRDWSSHEVPFWGYLVAASLFAALVPIVAAVGASLEGSHPLGRVAVAFAIAAFAGLALTSAAAASKCRPPKPERTAK